MEGNLNCLRQVCEMIKKKKICFSFLAPVSVTYRLFSDKNSRLTIFILTDDSQ